MGHHRVDSKHLQQLLNEHQDQPELLVSIADDRWILPLILQVNQTVGITVHTDHLEGILRGSSWDCLVGLDKLGPTTIVKQFILAHSSVDEVDHEVIFDKWHYLLH